MEAEDLWMFDVERVPPHAQKGVLLDLVEAESGRHHQLASMASADPRRIRPRRVAIWPTRAKKRTVLSRFSPRVIINSSKPADSPTLSIRAP